MDYCYYYQARIEPAWCWYFVAILRSIEHIAFDRTLDAKTSTFEFFVPADMEPRYLQIMDFFKQKGIASNIVRLPNRLIDGATF